ncbi:MAG: 5-methyltetrahydropteroyltriglutamate--homocysteine S-methyltransferase [Alphaproteobacteria bacterium]
MTLRTKPPFRADHVGSLLRPETLTAARDSHAKGEITAAELRAVEDDAIRDVVRLQEELGLEGITDGEFRRASWSSDFLKEIKGVTVTAGKFSSSFQRADGVEINHKPPTMMVTGKLRNPGGIQVADFAFLKSVVKKTPKVSIPSPSMLHFRGGRDAIDSKAYPDMEEFFADLAAVYREELRLLGEAGATYVQFDDTNFAYLCDPKIREATRARGEDLDALPRTYCRLLNEAIRDRPADMSVCVHMCRGNFRSAWVAEGGYEPVAEVLFNELDVDGIFMEYDDERSGDFAPLRFVPKGKTIVLGLLTSKRAQLEPADEIRARIDEAGKYIALDQLALSPQCGFSSTAHGNELGPDDQAAKLGRIVELAGELWG